MPHELSTSNASPERGIRMCLTWCRHGRPRRLTCQVPVAGHQRRDRSRAFPGPVLRGVVRNRPSGAPGRQKLEDVCGPPGRMSPLNEGHDHDDSAECPCHWRASSSGKQGSKWGKTGSGEPRIFPARWPFTRDYQISTVCFASRGSWVRFPSSPPGLTKWKATGQRTVRKQRDKWVVRVDGIDTATGKHRLRQLGTFASQRSANAAARSMKTEDRSTERGTVSWLVRRYVASRTDITVKARQQYEWGDPAHRERSRGLGWDYLASRKD